MGTLSIPSGIRDKMICIVCKNYLSYFPIYVKNDGSGGTCGRCKIPEKETFTRDEAYESIAQFIVFPCQHSATGCKEELTPYYLEEHERLCVHRTFPCPSKSYTKCLWTGTYADLISHFSETHPDLLMKEAKFELNFVNSSRENALLTFGEDLFIIKKEIDSRMGIFLCTVQHLRSAKNTENYNYFLRIVNADMTFSHKFPDRSTMDADNTTKVSSDFVRDKLRNPASVVVNIEIVKANRMENKEEKQVVKEKDPNIDWAMLGELECPICYDFMLPPIFQCLNGHSLCNECKPKVTACPICQATTTDTKNFVLEKMTQYLTYPCKFHKSGCTYSCKSAEIRKHEDSCEYGPYDCPLNELRNCHLKINKVDMISHVENNHNDALLKSESVTVPFNRGDNKEYCYLIVYSEKTFKLLHKYANEKFYWALQLVGPQEGYKNFKFEIEIIDNSESNLKCYFKGLCVPFTKNSDSFNKSGKYIMMTYEQLDSYISDYFTFNIRVTKD